MDPVGTCWRLKIDEEDNFNQFPWLLRFEIGPSIVIEAKQHGA